MGLALSPDRYAAAAAKAGTQLQRSSTIGRDRPHRTLEPSSRTTAKIGIDSNLDILSALAAAMTNQNCDELRDAVNMVNQDFAAAPLLAHALLEDWHDSHEDIVFELGLIGNPTVVSAISCAAKTQFQSLVEWGNVRAFQRKCAYALARIGTDESRTALEDMIGSEDDYLRQVGKEGLSH